MPPAEGDKIGLDTVRSLSTRAEGGDEPLQPVNDGMGDVQANVNALLFAGEGEIRDKRLLNIDGIFEVMKQLGIEYMDSALDSPMNADAIIGACMEYKNEVVGEAMALAYAGRLSRNDNQLPLYTCNETQDPISAYLGALKLLDDFLDAQTTGVPLTPGRLTEYFVQGREQEFAKAVQAATDFETHLFRTIHERGGADILLKERAENTGVVLYDSKGKRIEKFTSFQLPERTLAGDTELQALNVKGGMMGMWDNILAGGKGPGAGPDPQAFVRKFLPVDQYPDKTVSDNATVQEVVAVLPMHPDKQEALFKVIIPGVGIGVPYTIKIITGDTNQTANTYFIDKDGGPGIIGLPSGANGSREQFFSARRGGDLGEKRAEEAGRVGKRFSTSVIIVMQPAVVEADHGFLNSIALLRSRNQKKAATPRMFRMKIANEILKSGKAADKAVAMLIERNVFEEGPDAEDIRQWCKEEQDVPFLCSILDRLPEEESGWTATGLTSTARRILDDGRDSDDLIALLVAKGLLAADKAELLRGVVEGLKNIPKPKFRGLSGLGGGGDPFGSMQTMGLTRGGGDFLHTGASGIGSGDIFRQAKETWKTDPLRPARILIMRPFGISGKEEDGTLDGLVDHLN